MKRKRSLPGGLLAAGILLTACAGATSPTSAPVQPPSVTTQPRASLPARAATADSLLRGDAQGGVEFGITPLNLSSPGKTVEFDVSMNTHSVDLSWDLAAQSVLSTDTGFEVRANGWPVGSGHHVEGRLTFPASTADGKPLLDGASILTLTIRDAGAPERVFVWELGG